MKKFSIIGILIIVLTLCVSCVPDDPIQDMWTYNLYPTINNVYDIGSNTYQYRSGFFGNLYLNGSILNVSAMVGPQGPQGPQGNGTAATVTVNSTTTGLPGTNALVINIGNTTDAIFDFIIPQGIQGLQGPQGLQGNPGMNGLNGSTGPNLINSSTQTTFVGFLSGNGSYVTASENITTKNMIIDYTEGVELCPYISGADWTGTNWIIGSGSAQHVASDVQTLYPTVPIVPNIGTTYKVVYTVSDWTAGGVVMTLGGVSGVLRGGNSTFTRYVDPYTTGNLIFTPTASFRGNISAISVKVITDGQLTVMKNIWTYDDRGVLTSTAALYSHLSELATNTLLDRSRSILTCSDGVLTYTLYAMDGTGTWNFAGVTYPVSVASASIPLIAGTNISPVTNYIYFELIGGTPTLAVNSIEPTGVHIDVATFVVGTVSGTNYTIYSYNRNREEIDTFISRTIQRIADSGTLYISGLLPTVNSTFLNVSSGGKFYNGIFPMITGNTVSISGGYYYVNSSGKFVQSTSLADLKYYADGTALGVNERQNIVWGIVPTTTTTGGALPTTVRLVAVLQSKPTSVYTNDQQAREDLYEATNYYPPNDELKKVFVPIAKTIVRPNTPEFISFASGLYLKDIRGKITSGGGAAVAPDTSYLVPYIGATSNLTYGGMILRLDGTIQPASLADISTENNSVYYSTDANKLVFKDSSGVVHELY